MRIYTSFVSRWNEELQAYVPDMKETVSFEWSGAVELCCGASNEQKDIEQQQQSSYSKMTAQAGQVFGNSSSVFNDLMSTFTPTVLAGPSQAGFSPAELSALKSQAITQTGQAYKNAKYAAGEAQAAQGGGNFGDVTGGSKAAADLNLAESEAEQTSSELNQIDQKNYEVGRQNYDTAVKGLSGSTDVFNPVAGLDNAATSGGKAAADTADQISTQNSSWVQAVTGALGSVAGTVLTGGMSNLGKGVGFFGSGTSTAKKSN